MPKSDSKYVFRVTAFGLIFTLWQATAWAVELNKINACGEIKTVQRFLEKVTDKCKQPLDVIGRSIKRTLEQSGASHCVLEHVPISSLQDYTCIKSATGDQSDLLCYRLLPVSQIEEYKSKFDEKYKYSSNQYIEAGRTCEGSNGESTTTGPTLYPPVLAGVSAHEFGFIVQHGSTKPGDSLVSHGFGRLNPNVGDPAKSAIEYIQYVRGLKPYNDKKYIHGNWRLEVDKSVEWMSPITKTLKKNGIKSYVAGLNIDLERSARAPALNKDAFTSFDLMNEAADLIEGEGFREIRSSEFKARTGYSKDDLKTELVKRTPFGVKEYFGYSEADFRFFMRTTGLACMKNERGAIGAYFIAIEGDKDVKVDFGSVFFMLVGLGACASESGVGVTHVKNILVDLNGQTMASLKKF